MLSRKLQVLAGLTLLAVFAVFIGCSKKSRDANTITIAQDIAEIISIDPGEAHVSSSVNAIKQAYSRLLKRNANGVVEADEIVESFEFRENGKILRIKINPGFQFASGNALTAEDVVYTIHRVILMQKPQADNLGPLGYTPKNVTTLVRYVDQWTLDLELPRKVSPAIILSCLTTSATAVVDSKLVKKHAVGDDYGNEWLRKSCAGSGPFTIVSWQPGEILVLKKNPMYKGRYMPKVNTLIFRHVVDVATRSLLLQRGEADIAWDMPQEFLTAVDLNKFVIQKLSRGCVWYLNLNQNNKYLQHPNVQQAIRHLLKFEEIAQIFGSDLTKPLPTIIPRGFDGYVENPMLHGFDPEKARNLVHCAFGGDIELEIDVYNLAVGQALQSTFAKGGIKLKLNYCDNKQATQRLRSRVHTMTLKHYTPDFPDAHSFIAAFVAEPGSLAWRNHLDNSDMSEIVLAAAQAVDAKERIRILKEIQAQYLLKKPILMVAESYQAHVASKNIEGFAEAFAEPLQALFYTLRKNV